MFSRQKPICQMISLVKTHLDCWSWEALLLLQLPSWGVYWWWPPAWPDFPPVLHCWDWHSFLQLLSRGCSSASSAQLFHDNKRLTVLRNYHQNMVRLWVSGTNGLLLPGHQFQWSLSRDWLKIAILRRLVLMDGCLTTEKAMLLHWAAVWCFLRKRKQETKPALQISTSCLCHSDTHFCDFRHLSILPLLARIFSSPSPVDLGKFFVFFFFFKKEP